MIVSPSETLRLPLTITVAGEHTDADALPTAELWTGDTLVSDDVTVVSLAGTGEYEVRPTIPVNALAGERFRVRAEAEVGGVTLVRWLGAGVVLPSVVLGGEQAGQLAAASEGGGFEADDRDKLLETHAKLMGLGAGEITIVSPVGADLSVTLRRARDYHSADGRALEWVNADGTWPDLTDADFDVLVARPGSRVARFSFSGEVVTPTGENQTLRLELTREQLGMVNDEYAYEGKATLASGRVVDLAGVSGPFSVLLGRDDPA